MKSGALDGAQEAPQPVAAETVLAGYKDQLVGTPNSSG